MRTEAYALFNRACASPIAHGFLLYELYIRAAGFRSFGGAQTFGAWIWPYVAAYIAVVGVAAAWAFARRDGPTLIEVPVGPFPTPWPFIFMPPVRSR